MLPKTVSGLEIKTWCTGIIRHEEMEVRCEGRMNMGEVFDEVMETGNRVVVIVCLARDLC